jgi:hypothetical protein
LRRFSSPLSGRPFSLACQWRPVETHGRLPLPGNVGQECCRVSLFPDLSLRCLMSRPICRRHCTAYIPPQTRSGSTSELCQKRASATECSRVRCFLKSGHSRSQSNRRSVTRGRSFKWGFFLQKKSKFLRVNQDHRSEGKSSRDLSTPASPVTRNAWLDGRPRKQRTNLARSSASLIPTIELKRGLDIRFRSQNGL